MKMKFCDVVITMKRFFIMICAASGYACKEFIKELLLSLRIWESSVVRTVKGCGLQYNTPISPNMSSAIALFRT